MNYNARFPARSFGYVHLYTELVVVSFIILLLQFPIGNLPVLVITLIKLESK